MFQNTTAAENKSPGNFCQSPQEAKELPLSTVDRGATPAEVDRKLAQRGACRSLLAQEEVIPVA